MNLRILSETPTTVTVGWDPVPGAVGYDFYIDAKRVSFTHDGTKTSVKFGKPDAGLHDYGVESLMHGSSGVILVPAPAPPPPPPASNIGNFKGANIYATTGVNGLQNARDTAGITRVRAEYWLASQPAFLSEARRLGMKVDLLACYSLGLNPQGDHYPPNDFGAWATKVVQPLTGNLDVIEAVQPWNEPFNTFWAPKPNPAEYLRLVMSLAPKVWSIAPELPVVVCLDYWQGGTGSGRWDSALLAADTTKFLTDPRVRFSAHCYCQESSPQTNRGAGWSFDRYKLAHDAALAHGHPNPQIWVTEWGWDTPGGSETYPVSEALQAQYVVDGIKMMQASGIVERAFVYQWKADDWYGLMKPDGTPRPVCAAVKALV